MNTTDICPIKNRCRYLKTKHLEDIYEVEEQKTMWIIVIQFQLILFSVYFTIYRTEYFSYLNKNKNTLVNLSVFIIYVSVQNVLRELPITRIVYHILKLTNIEYQ